MKRKLLYVVTDNIRGLVGRVMANNVGHAMHLFRKQIGDRPPVKDRSKGVPAHRGSVDGEFIGYTIGLSK